jgi:hypothetical protein
VIIAAATVKDSRENVEKFVARNLRGGIDHVVVFLDAPLPDVEDLLDGHADVTLVRAYGGWWAGSRPDDLNERQVCNHGLVSQAVAGFSWAEWMFVLDGDEVARIDRTVLAGLDPGTRAVRLLPLEAVSRMDARADPTWFKRRPTADELVLLRLLGVVPEAKMRAYFRGHASGKPGLRPAKGYALGVHHAVDTSTAQRVPMKTDPGLTMLHYESPNGQEFVRKWRALIGSGSDNIRQTGRRSSLARSISTVLDLPAPESVTTSILEEIYRRSALDDVETLSRLGLLVEADPDSWQHRPVRDERGVGQLRTMLDRAHDLPKLTFRPHARDRGASRAVARLQRRL